MRRGKGVYLRGGGGGGRFNPPSGNVYLGEYILHVTHLVGKLVSNPAPVVKQSFIFYKILVLIHFCITSERRSRATGIVQKGVPYLDHVTLVFLKIPPCSWHVSYEILKLWP